MMIKKYLKQRLFLGRNGVTTNKKEGDLKTPIGSFNLGIAFWHTRYSKRTSNTIYTNK